jgi:dCTP deaminase
MSILSGAAIEAAVRDGKIVIDGFDPKYLNPASYDLTLGNKVGVYKEGLLDAKSENDYGIHAYATGSARYGIILKPGKLYLMHTVERIGSKTLVSVIDGKSSIGRLGICVHLTAGYGDPGFLGQYTLEVTCVREVIVYPGMRFAQVRFHTMELGGLEPTQYEGNYVGATAEGPVPSKSWKQFEDKT